MQMNKENTKAPEAEGSTGRITRARAKALVTSVGILPSSKPSFKQDQKRVLRANSKRAASDENKAFATAASGLQCKRRAVLKDVTNILGEDSFNNCINAAKIQTYKQGRRGPLKKKVVGENASVQIPLVEEDVKMKLAEDLSKIRMEESQEITSPAKVEERYLVQQMVGECGLADLMLIVQASTTPTGFQSLQKKEENKVFGISGTSNGLGIIDIDSNLKDPQVCSLYAPDIYNNIRVTELHPRSSTDYMEKLQTDITPTMRGILIDWLVEVSEEYKLVPDTLYLTVNLIDRFLSQTYIEKQKLQLLGVTCMLIASKYEEICAPRIEEFCFITDYTYTKGQVLKMESQVLNFLHFQLSIPTTKTFLRRFILAAQASYKVPSIELEFLANYLSELTLVEYNFLQFLPSLIAAAAVFLARWTLNQSDHPWNQTLEHYTRYKASDLKTTVLALEDLQFHTDDCTLNAVREKYRLKKFKCVATLTAPGRVLSLF